MTEYHLKIIFVIVLCAPILYFGIKFFMSLVNSAIAGKKIPKRRREKSGNGDAPGANRRSGSAPIADGRGDDSPGGRKRTGRSGRPGVRR